MIDVLRKRFRDRITDRPGLMRILHNFSWLLVDRVIRVFLGMVVTVLMARYLGPEQFGIISYALAITGLCGMVALLGLNQVVVHDLVQNPSTAGITLGSARGLMAVGGLVAYTSLVVAVLLTRSEDSFAKLASFAIGASVLFRFLDFGRYWFESQVQSKYVVLAQLAVFFGASLAKVVLIVLDAPLSAFILVVTAQAVATPVATSLVFWSRAEVGTSLRFDAERARALLSASWPLLLAGFAMMVNMKIDQLMIASMLGDQAVGVYSAAVSVSEATYALAVIITATTYPAVLAARAEGEEVYRARFQQLFDLIVVLAVAIAVPVTFGANWIISTLFGESYLAAGAVLTVHVWALIFVFLGVVSDRWFIAEGRPKLNLQRTVLGVCVNVVLNFVLIPRFGLIGAATATIVAHSVAAFFSDLIQAKSRPLFGMKLAALNVPGAILRLVRHF
jgi:PST family polysaccharide transporter